MRGACVHVMNMRRSHYKAIIGIKVLFTDANYRCLLRRRLNGPLSASALTAELIHYLLIQSRYLRCQSRESERTLMLRASEFEALAQICCQMQKPFQIKLNLL